MSYMFILMCSMMDHLLTHRYLSMGGQELNPVMDAVMAYPFWASFAIKNGWTALMLVCLFYLGKKSPLLVKRGLAGMIAVYAMLIIYHVYGFAFCY